MSEEIKKKYKIDPEFRRKMRAHEEKQREEAMQAAAAVEAQPPEEAISFDLWWMMVSKQGKMRSHLKEILLADFMARGLTKMEPKEKYDEALKVLGIQL